MVRFSRSCWTLPDCSVGGNEELFNRDAEL